MSRGLLLLVLLLGSPAWSQEGPVLPRSIDEYLLAQLDRFGPDADPVDLPPGMTRARVVRGDEVVEIVVPVQPGQSRREDRRAELERLVMEADPAERAAAIRPEIARAIEAAEARAAAVEEAQRAAVQARLEALRAIRDEIRTILDGTPPAP